MANTIKAQRFEDLLTNPKASDNTEIEKLIVSWSVHKNPSENQHSELLRNQLKKQPVSLDCVGVAGHILTDISLAVDYS